MEIESELEAPDGFSIVDNFEEEEVLYKDADGTLYYVSQENLEDFLEEHADAKEAGLTYDPQGSTVDQSYNVSLKDNNVREATVSEIENLQIDVPSTAEVQIEDVVEYGFQEDTNKYDQALEVINSEYEEKVEEKPFSPTNPYSVDVLEFKEDPLLYYAQANAAPLPDDLYKGMKLDYVPGVEIAKLSSNENVEIATQTNSSIENVELAKQGQINQDNIQKHTDNDLYDNLVFTSFLYKWKMGSN